MRHLNKKYWPYQIDILNTIVDGIFYRRSADEIVMWCRQNMNRQHMHYGANDIIRFAFTDSESYLVFKLKWGHHEYIKKTS